MRAAFALRLDAMLAGSYCSWANGMEPIFNISHFVMSCGSTAGAASAFAPAASSSAAAGPGRWQNRIERDGILHRCIVVGERPFAVRTNHESQVHSNQLPLQCRSTCRFDRRCGTRRVRRFVESNDIGAKQWGHLNSSVIFDFPFAFLGFQFSMTPSISTFSCCGSNIIYHIAWETASES